jgi:hypothetical protein
MAYLECIRTSISVPFLANHQMIPDNTTVFESGGGGVGEGGAIKPQVVDKVGTQLGTRSLKN